ncbi:kinesin [Trichoderma gamsii]|uniref:Kinesin n=1 Tax=Trichoderma gamsii TaxID=398673 RepID=A0A2P4ZR36_9HYPO|nr:kinesin [Trichoderma gamsii]PON26759.1 kinesin [Trichoderma gamsii]
MNFDLVLARFSLGTSSTYIDSSRIAETMDELTPERLTNNSYTVGWICALDVELAASVAMLDYEHPKLSQVQGDTNTYVLGQIDQHNIVLTCLPSGTTGTNAAANAATNMLRSFPSIRFCLMVGIGGGAPSVSSDDPCGDIRLGDVVISCPSANSGGVLQYDFGKTMSEGKFIQTGVLNKTSIVLSSSVSTLRARHRIEESRIPQYIARMLKSNRKMQREFSHPGLEHDQLFRADYEHPNGAPTCHSCDIEVLLLRKSRGNTNAIIHYGLIGSANQVMRHGATRDKLRDEKNIICFEMEAAGLMDVFPCLVIRGICDYADSHKNKNWQPYAAVTAAACAKEVLLATPASEVPIKTFFTGEAIYNMLQATLDKVKWDQLLELLPLRDEAHHEYLETPENYYNPVFYWALRNIDFKQWRLNQGPRVLCITGHPSARILDQISFYVVDREKAAGNSALLLFCSSIIAGTSITTFFLMLLLELVHCSPEEQRTSITRLFFSKLLETLDVGIEDWEEEKFNEETFLKYMKNILKNATTWNVFSSLKTAFGIERQRRLLIVISNLDAFESVNEPDGYVLPLIKDLQQQNANIKILLTSSERFDTTQYYKGFMHIEHNKERQECLRSLQFDNTRYDKITKEHEGSFGWIWSHDEYKTWSASDTSRLLYIQGKPGSGKSTLMKYFNQNLLLKEPAAQRSIVARFFYSFRDGELQRSHYNMLLSILYEILYQDEGFFYHHCQAEYRAHRHSEPHFKWSYDSLKRTLKSLQDYRTNKRYYLTIDAIDESEEKDRREILGLLFDLCSETKHSVVKIFMASRPVAQLEARRGQFHNFINLDDETRFDIYNYAQSQLHSLNSTNLLSQATAYMLQNAQGVFLWVKLISEQLIEAHEEGYSEEEVFELLKRLPTELEDFYCLMLEKMKHNKSSLSHAAKIFRFILFARRPLTVDEVLHVIGISNSVDSNTTFIPSDVSFERFIPSSERIILSSGGNFLEIKMQNGNKIVQFMHQTVREFFLNPHGPVANSEFWVSDKYAHINIAVTCIQYLSVCVTNTSLAEEFPDVNNWDTTHYRDYCHYLNRRPLAAYALGYIGSHVEICEPSSNIEYATSQLIEHLTEVTAGAYLLESWACSGLRQGFLSTRNTQGAVAMAFKCEILRYSSIHGLRIATELALLAETVTDFQDKDGRTPLSLAAGSGHEAIVKLLLDKGAKVDSNDNNGLTPLSWAAINGHRNIVIWLSEHGASTDQSDNHGRSPLSWAADQNHLDIVKCLVEKGAYINRGDRFGRSPLFLASKHGHLAIVEFLFNNGAIIEHVDKLNITPFSFAAEKGHLAIVKFLARKGAVTDRRNQFGRTPLSLAAEHGHSAIVKYLVEQAVSMETRDNSKSPLSWAAARGHLAIVKFLTEKGANIENTDWFGLTPLSWAATYGHLAVVRLLIEKGACINTRDASHKTPLFLAVEHNHLDVIKFLAGKGAATEIGDDSGRTPVSVAVENSRLDIVKFLAELC